MKVAPVRSCVDVVAPFVTPGVVGVTVVFEKVTSVKLGGIDVTARSASLSVMDATVVPVMLSGIDVTASSVMLQVIDVKV